MTPARRRQIRPTHLALTLIGAVAWNITSFDVATAQQQPAVAQPKAQAEPQNAPKKKPAAKKEAKPKADPTAAQDQVEAGVAALGQGRNDAAVASLTSAISAGSLPQAQSARALYYRGVAYRRQAKPAQAISDLTNALWIKNGLTEDQRADALQQRSGAYREAGLPDQGPPATSAPAKSAASAKATPATTMFTSVAPAPAAAAGGSAGSGFFNSIFGGTTAPAQAAPAPPTATAAATQPRSAPILPDGFQPHPGDSSTFYQGPSRSSATSQQAQAPQQVPQAQATQPQQNSGGPVTKPWTDATQVKTAAAPQAKSPPKVATATPAVAQPPAAEAAQKAKKSTANVATAARAPGGPVPVGAITVQVASSRSAEEAQGVARRLQTSFSRELGGRAPIVEQTSTGSLGTIYRVQVGPFASARDTEPLCARLKGDGLDCRVVGQ